MVDKSRVIMYFDKQASSYDFRSNNSAWGYIREIEKSNILELLEPDSGDVILDAGSGSGFYAGLMKEMGCNVLAVDFSAKMIEEVEAKGIIAVNCDLENLKLEERFDKIICAGVLEFTDNSSCVINNLKLHLRKGGFIVFLVPQFSFLGILYKLYHLAHGVSIRLFTLSQIKSLFKKSSLKIDLIKPVMPYSFVIKAIQIP